MGSDSGQVVLFDVQAIHLAPELSPAPGALKSKWPLGNLDSWKCLISPEPASFSSYQEDGRDGGRLENTGWHEVPWEPVRDHRVMRQNPGIDGWDDRVILSPWHWENSPESPASTPEGLNAKVQ